MQTAVANVKNAEAAVATARLTAESKEELFKEHVVSDFDLQTARNSLFQAEATLAQAKADEINARNNLSYTEVKSPVDGVSGMLPYRVGALVDASISTPLTTVSDDEEMYVYFSMTESQILSLIRANKTLEEALKQMPEVELQLSDGLTYDHKGKIDAISGTIDANTGAVSLRATFPNPEHMLRNGGSGTIIFPYVKENALIVPQEATFEIQDKVYVYKVNESGKAESAQVTVFPLNNGQEYIVESGLQEGEVIVAEGAGLIQENTQILSLHTENRRGRYELKTFIDRPILSCAISVLILILGVIGLSNLPMEQYPDIAPPTIMVSTTYTGANAETVLKSVIAPLEEAINGVENMTYMTSTATNTGSASITVYFAQGTDPDMATVTQKNVCRRRKDCCPQK